MLGGLVGGADASAQELWNGARFGMTPLEVQNAFPQAAKGERSLEGQDLILRVSALRAGGHDATAAFDFTGDRLRSVALSLSPVQVGGSIDADEVRTQLSAKYGPPVACNEARETCEWRNGGIDITMIAAGAKAGERVEILYETSAPAPRFARAAPTPIELARAFYGDLAIGDGDGASQLVVPDKRGSGPFSPEALTGFYASLTKPVRLVSAYPHSGGAVLVHYRFTAAGGHSCDGDADVRTGWVDGRLLIESIHAYSGC
ncbi:MAG: hypothetical protein ABI906_05280 [Pseudomonadota bacterium]